MYIIKQSKQQYYIRHRINQIELNSKNKFVSFFPVDFKPILQLQGLKKFEFQKRVTPAKKMLNTILLSRIQLSQ